MSNQVCTGAECREIDQLAMQRLGLSEMQLMQRAARAALNALVHHWPDAQRIAVYCGPGNNGGDGYLLAAGAKTLGLEVSLFALGTPVSDTARAARQEALSLGLEIQPLAEDGFHSFDAQADLIVDALFGHGLVRDIGPPLDSLFEWINNSSIPVFSLDVPSGINSDTGSVMGIALDAELTICFVAPKIGLLTGAGVNYAGAVLYDALGIPPSVSEAIRASFQPLTERLLRTLLPEPRPASHKGDFGHVAVIGGQPGMPGAALLAALAAARAGAGRVTVVSSDQHTAMIPLAAPVLMTSSISAKGDVNWPATTTAIVLGPGMGTAAGAKGAENWSSRVFGHALEQAIDSGLPLVVDADALILLARYPQRYENWVLSPHPKEAAALLGCSVKEVQADRPAACQKISERYGGVCVLKGKGSLVVEATDLKAICSHGNWGMATAGSGDVLSGICGALLGQGMLPYDAACAAVYAHARAGEMAAERVSKRAMIASDIIDSLCELFLVLES